MISVPKRMMLGSGPESFCSSSSGLPSLPSYVVHSFPIRQFLAGRALFSDDRSLSKSLVRGPQLNNYLYVRVQAYWLGADRHVGGGPGSSDGRLHTGGFVCTYVHEASNLAGGPWHVMSCKEAGAAASVTLRSGPRWLLGLEVRKMGAEVCLLGSLKPRMEQTLGRV